MWGAQGKEKHSLNTQDTANDLGWLNNKVNRKNGLCVVEGVEYNLQSLINDLSPKGAKNILFLNASKGDQNNLNFPFSKVYSNMGS